MRVGFEYTQYILVSGEQKQLLTMPIFALTGLRAGFGG